MVASMSEIAIIGDRNILEGSFREFGLDING
jgi:hypothetical protein